jgi:hypothetical protein
MASATEAAPCAWCIPPAALPAYRGGLCNAHWNEAHDYWDADA